MSYLIAKRYAKALFDLSCEQQRATAVREDMKKILGTMDASMDLVRFFDNPIIPAAKRRSILREIFEGRVDALVYHFILFLEEKRRLRVLRDIIHAFERLFLEAHNISKVKITTSAGLTAHQRDELVKSLHAKFNKVIEPKMEVDPALLGGVKVQEGDDIYDYSLRAQLKKFQRRVVSAL